MKKGGELEIIANDFLERICGELGLLVTTKRVQQSGSQDGYDSLTEVIDDRSTTYSIYCECKDYTTKLNYTELMIKLPQLSSTHGDIDLALFLSPHKPFSNILEPTRNRPFLEAVASNLFPVAFLTPDQNIEEYLSLYPDLYEKIYNRDAAPVTAEQRNIVLKSFRAFLFSDRLLNKVIINETDRDEFIGQLQSDDHTISRTLRPSQGRSVLEIYNPSGVSLISALYSTKKGIVLLGGAGYGKSTELRNFAIQAWKSRENGQIIPKFVRLKTFNSTTTIESLLPSKALRIRELVIILDGVDEVENITDFTNKLRAYIDQHEKQLDRYKIRFIISCRTNVYRKYIKQVADFNEFYLNEVAFSDAAFFLWKKFGLDLTSHPKFDYGLQRQLYENPFYLELIGKYYQTHKTLRTDKATLIREFVNSRLKHDEDDKFINDTAFDIDRITSQTKIAAFAFESLQKTNLSAAELKRATGMEEIALAKNPFLEENADGSWAFENKNIQEYFVATLLVDLPFEEIIRLIRIDPSISKVHPTWYNVVSFTLNLDLPQEVYSSLVNWLSENDYEVLFNADANLISDDIKQQMLKSYFELHCERETLWVSDPAQIARFSQTEGSIKYLLTNIVNDGIHRRARMSAIKLLSNMDVPSKYHSDIKVLIKTLLGAKFTDEDYIYIKEDLIELAKSLGLNQDIDFFNEVISIVRDDDHREIISTILRSVPSASFEENLDYFLIILDKALGLIEWRFTARTRSATSTKEKVFDHFKKIDDPDVLLRIYKFLLERHKENSLKESVLKDFLLHLESVFKLKPDYNPILIEMISNAVITGNIRDYEDDLLVSLVKACGIEKPVAENILEAVEGNSSTKHFLADILLEEDFTYIIDRYNSGAINDDFMKEFRNVLSHSSIERSKRFEVFAEQHCNYRFPDKITMDEVEERTRIHKADMQDNFNILFDRDALIGQIKYMYDFLGKDTMSNKDLETIYMRHHYDLGLFTAVRSNAKQLLGQMIRQGKSLKLSDVPKRLKGMELDIIFDIYEALPKPDKKNTVIELSKGQLKFIENWCLTNAERLKGFYDNRLIADKKERYTEEFQVYELIYNFQKLFLFDLDKETLLNFLYFKLWNAEDKQEFGAAKLSEQEIGDRVVWNIKHVELPSSSYYGHICYCLEHGIDLKPLNIDFIAIITCYLDSGSETTGVNLIEKLYSHDNTALLHFLEYKGEPRVRRMLYDAIIRIWNEGGNKGLTLQFLLDCYLELTESLVYDELDIINRLVGCNEATAFGRLREYVKSRLVKNKIISLQFRHDEWQRYTNPKAIADLVALLELYLTTSNADKIFDRFTLPTRIASEALINICKNRDAAICTEVIAKLSGMDFTRIAAAGGDLFYYHRLKNDIQEIYYKHKSKAFSLKEVITILEENRHLFVP